MVKEVKTLALRRVPPGDNWEDANERSDIFESLTEGLEHAFHSNKGNVTQFFLDTKVGTVELISYEDEPDPDPEPPKKYSMYGEEL